MKMDILAGLTPPPPQLVFYSRSDYVTFLRKQEEAASEMYHDKSDWYAAMAAKEQKKERVTVTIDNVNALPAVDMCPGCLECSAPPGPPYAPEAYTGNPVSGVVNSARVLTPELVRPVPVRPAGKRVRAFMPLRLVELEYSLRLDFESLRTTFVGLRQEYFELLPHTRERAKVHSIHRYNCRLHFDGKAGGRAEQFEDRELNGEEEDGEEELNFEQVLDNLSKSIDSIPWTTDFERASNMATDLYDTQKGEMYSVANLLECIDSSVKAYKKAETQQFQNTIAKWENGVEFYERVTGPLGSGRSSVQGLEECMKKLKRFGILSEEN